MELYKNDHQNRRSHGWQCKEQRYRRELLAEVVREDLPLYAFRDSRSAYVQPGCLRPIEDAVYLQSHWAE